MSRTFRYIQNDDVLKTFNELKDTTLKERALVIARHGDYSLFLERLDDRILGIRIMNTEKDCLVSSRKYDIDNTTAELVSRGVRHACQKMSELSDEDVNNKRFQIWKWHLLDYQKTHPDERLELIGKAFSSDEDKMKHEKELMDMESFLHGEYLNLGNTLRLIEEYIPDVHYREVFKKFAIADIMELSSEDTRVKAIEEREKIAQKEGEVKHHTYRFTVTVEATDKEHARQALLNYLAGDDRIHIQK